MLCEVLEWKSARIGTRTVPVPGTGTVPVPGRERFWYQEQEWVRYQEREWLVPQVYIESALVFGV